MEFEREGTGFGVNVTGCRTAADVLEKAHLDWTVVPRKTFYMDAEGNFKEVDGVFQNVREEDGKPLGTVSGKYKVCQNREAFEFIDELVSSGLEYERAGSFYGGKSVWLQAKMPENKIILGDPVKQSLIFSNSHDGSAAVRVMITPMRIACSNALTLATRKASRKWACSHTGQISYKLEEARSTLVRAEEYMDVLRQACEGLAKTPLTITEVNSLIRDLIPMPDDATKRQAALLQRKRADLAEKYFGKPDLTGMPHTAYRFVNAVSDWATHTVYKETANAAENLFKKTVEGHEAIDRAYRFFTA